MDLVSAYNLIGVWSKSNTFRTNYIDGQPIKTSRESDRQQLLKAIAKYNANIESTIQHEKNAHKALDETRLRLQKLQTLANSSKKNAAVATTVLKRKKNALISSRSGSKQSKVSETTGQEMAAARVKDIKMTLSLVAKKRREQATRNKTSSSTASILNSLPDISNALKKSLWHRLHRRKQAVVLRPTPEVLLNKLLATVEAAADGGGKKGRNPKSQEKLEKELLRAEQLFLLAMHPFADGTLPAVPPFKSNEPWAEPGWKLDLSVGRRGVGRTLLPCAEIFPLLEKNLAEISTAPGRQAAFLIQNSTFHGVSSPLSRLATLTSPAETKISISQRRGK